jgi:hypothetical protein
MMKATTLALALCLSLTGCGASYMAGYTSKNRAICLRWDLHVQADDDDPLTCELEAP